MSCFSWFLRQGDLILSAQLVVENNLVKETSEEISEEIFRKGSSLLIIAGEASGDLHGAGVVRALRARFPDLEVVGMGGKHLLEAGMHSLVDSSQVGSVMGLAELWGKIKSLRSALSTIERWAKENRPNVAVLIDFPDFNFLLSRRLSKLGIPMVYFIAPQVWAWRSGRVKTIRKRFAKVAAIVPFEEPYFQQRGVDATFVGHPLAYQEALESKESIRQELGFDKHQRIIAIVPGSRESEIERLLPVILQAVSRLRRHRADLIAVLPVASSLSIEYVAEVALRSNIPDLFSWLRFTEGKAREVMRISDVAVVASGTATVECALEGTPFVVVYKLAPFTYSLAKRLVRGVKFITMVNIVANRKVVPELIQGEVTPERIASELEDMLGNKSKRERIAAELKEAAKAFTLVEQDSVEQDSVEQDSVEQDSVEGKTPWERVATIVEKYL